MSDNSWDACRQNSSHPEGMNDNSPTFQRWDNARAHQSVPKGRLTTNIISRCSLSARTSLKLGAWSLSGAWMLVLGAFLPMRRAFSRALLFAAILVLLPRDVSAKGYSSASHSYSSHSSSSSSHSFSSG